MALARTRRRLRAATPQSTDYSFRRSGDRTAFHRISPRRGHYSLTRHHDVSEAPPVIWIRRTLSKDHTLSGVDLKTGDKVLLIYNSANRDDEASVDPNVFDVGRTPKDYFGFGVP